MKTTFKIALLLILLTSPLMLSAQQVSTELAKQKALTFLTQSGKSSAKRSASNKAPRLILANDRNEFYVFNDEVNGGYVVVSGDERMPDVLGYSYTGHFDAENIPCNMRAWLEDYASQVIYLRSHPEAQASRRTKTSRDEISPLLKCHFDQGKYYNDKCPIVDGEHCFTGCTATAMAQIMYYYQWPKQTTGIIPGYTTKTKRIDMPDIPITTIDWDNMLEQYDSEEEYSEKQVDAISTLMLLCGTSSEMDYNLDGSGALLAAAAEAFYKYFDYSDLVEYSLSRNMEFEIWIQLLYDELSSGRPVLYEGYFYDYDLSLIGHAFVLDGYKDGYFHVNWGWGGNSDDYFLLTDLNGFNVNQGAVFGIQPNNDNYPSRYAVLDNGKLTLYYDKEKSHRSGTILSRREDWISTQATECVIDPSFANLEAISFASLFEYMWELKSIQGLEYLNTSKALDMSKMFGDCSGLTSIDVSGLKTDYVKNMRSMFHNCSSLTNLDLSGFKTDNVRNMDSMFENCSSLTNLDLSGFKTDNVTSMSSMFSRCSSLTSLDLSGFKTDNVTSMSSMFRDCSSLTNLDVSGFKTDHVIDMRYMFYNCSSLTNLDLSSFKTDKVSNMSRMFFGCSNLKSLDLSSFNTYSVKKMDFMFRDCSNLTTIYANEHWNMSNVESASYMFMDCNSLIGGAGTTYNSSTTSDRDYAHIDGGPEDPGYFTYKNSKLHTVTYIIDGEVYLVQSYEYGDQIVMYYFPTREGYDFAWSDLPETMPDHDIVIYGVYTLGIKNLLEEKHPIKVLSLEGRAQNKMQKGINIIRYSDGSVRKVLVK